LARKLLKKDITPTIARAWEEKMTSRTRQRILKNIRGEKGHTNHPEIFFPDPKYLFAVEVKEVINLAR